MHNYFIRIGAMAEIRLATSLLPLEHGRRVVVRSSRGIEWAEVTGRATSINDQAESERKSEHSLGKREGLDGEFKILRPTTSSDELLIERLGRYKRDAVEACREQLRSAGSQSVLLDVDQLLSGGKLLMHFLGEVDEIAREITEQIAQRYESIVKTREFAQLLDEGCGPDCGTGEGCGSGGCVGCTTSCKT